jgi:hypothetical protein
VSEWLKEHAWKACVRLKRTVGSNPTSSVMFEEQDFKGAIASTILFANELEELLKKPPTAERNRQVEEAIQNIRALCPALQVVALFDFFTPLEWLHSLPSLREGKAFVAILYLQQYPQSLTHEIRSRLDQLKKIATPELKKEIERLLS